MRLAAAYALCRDIARREAKNFYYSFRVLPPAKSDAMCAVYAFMRRADDLADDETKPVEVRRVEMAAWRAAWRASLEAPTSDPVFLALNDTLRRFSIPVRLIEDLVDGTTMDLDDGADGAVLLAGGLRGYRTFAELERYCYLVASVVGLVCIRIFGYTDPRAELLAERTGLAFQLTNILRDVKEDAERGRLYLPEQLLTEFAVTPEDVAALAAGGPLRPNERGMMHGLSARAWNSYLAAAELLPLIDADSRPALWVLVTIYSDLLHQVDALDGDVFSHRASVPTRRKLAILARGLGQSLHARVRR